MCFMSANMTSEKDLAGCVKMVGRELYSDPTPSYVVGLGNNFRRWLLCLFVEMASKEKLLIKNRRETTTVGVRGSRGQVTEHKQDQQDRGNNPLATAVTFIKDLSSTLFLPRKETRDLGEDLNDGVHIPYQDCFTILIPDIK